MASDHGNNAKQNIERMRNAASAGATWLTEMTEQNLKQGIAPLNTMMTTLCKSADVFGHQASRIRETSAALAERTMGNATELGNRLGRSKVPLEWVEAHSEFMSKQAEAMASGAQRPTTMKHTALLILVSLTASYPAMAKSHHGHHYVARPIHDANRSAAWESHSGITCEMVRAYVAKVGLVQAAAMAESAGITSGEKARARRCLAEKS